VNIAMNIWTPNYTYISWIPEELSASRKGLCSMWWVSYQSERKKTRSSVKYVTRKVERS